MLTQIRERTMTVTAVWRLLVRALLVNSQIGRGRATQRVLVGVGGWK